jgi:hypothetical protein
VIESERAGISLLHVLLKGLQVQLIRNLDEPKNGDWHLFNRPKMDNLSLKIRIHSAS